MGFIENLRRIRRERGISQEELAEQLKVSRQEVWHVKRRKRVEVLPA